MLASSVTDGRRNERAESFVRMENCSNENRFFISGSDRNITCVSISIGQVEVFCHTGGKLIEFVFPNWLSCTFSLLKIDEKSIMWNLAGTQICVSFNNWEQLTGYSKTVFLGGLSTLFGDRDVVHIVVFCNHIYRNSR